MTADARIRRLTMPKWGLSMQEGTIVEWLAAEGTEISAGDEIAEIETEKVNNAFEAPVSGLLRRHVARADQTVPVGGLIGILAPADVPDADIDDVVAAFEASFVPEAEADDAPEPQTVEVGGRTINFLGMGEGDAPPLLLVHGITADLESWMFNQPALATDRRVLALDLPGHGASTKDVGDAGIDWFAGILADFLDTQGIEAIHLAGHSFGGAICLAFALSNPSRVASLSLIAPAGLAPGINGELLDALVAADRRRGARQALEQLVHDPELVGRDMIEAFLRYKRTDGVPAALAAIMAAGFTDGQQRAVFADRLADAPFSVQCIWGANDRMIPAAQADALPEGVAVHRLPDTGHLAHMERAGQVNALIAAFLSAND